MGAGADFVNTTRTPGDAEINRGRDSETESDPEVIAQDIEHTRGEMTETIDAIQSRLEPERLSAEAKEVAQYAIDEAKGAVRELADQASAAVREATIGRVERMTASTRDGAESMKNDIFTTIKANPIPAALAAVGIGWLWMHHGSESGQRSYSGSGGSGRWDSQATGYGSHAYDSYGVSGSWDQSSAQQAQQMAGQVAGQVQERAGQMQHQLGDTAGQLQHQLADKAGQAQHQAQGFWQMLESNPIAAGALGLGIGAIAGMVVPETEQENQFMGETRDRVVGSVQEVAGQTLGKAQHIAEEAGHTAMEEAKSQGIMPGGASASGSPA